MAKRVSPERSSAGSAPRCFLRMQLFRAGSGQHGPRQAEKRAAPGIEPGTSRTRSENHTTRPSSRWRSTTSAGVLQAPRPPPATPTAAARTGDQVPSRHRDERSSRKAAAATPVGNMPRPRKFPPPGTELGSSTGQAGLKRSRRLLEPARLHECWNVVPDAPLARDIIHGVS